MPFLNFNFSFYFGLSALLFWKEQLLPVRYERVREVRSGSRKIFPIGFPFATLDLFHPIPADCSRDIFEKYPGSIFKKSGIIRRRFQRLSPLPLRYISLAPFFQNLIQQRWIKALNFICKTFSSVIWRSSPVVC